ncbi:hypothetical protein QX233_11915 [Chryseobacterium gambrini]|uniref:Uncharacterized protein n=1 Tax=Chryseobacterium gambrini TaxID=373672 RepID=A0AAJ1VKL4_9FLAO|nr:MULTISPECIES: hypothetical protein [Chryseobacterium]MDN4013171.1 hypothetical protein [Chryseobacterium gambrini]MDN4030140.1 hypothetical protein [Chryseobacterium gambrini]QWA40385.1 hypothetical protein KKI44_09370 [Chryseobacterium sp. ZHDP1]
MIKKLFPALLLVGSFSYAQIGINNENPSATLDITGNPADPAKFDGIIAPRITGTQLRAKNYTGSQNGAVVFVTQEDTSPAGQTVDVTASGYYYFDGSSGKWIKLLSAAATQKIKSMSSGTVAADDYTVLVGGNITLPSATSTNRGKVYQLINDTSGNVTITGTFRINGGNFSNYGLNNSDLGRGIVVQSTGSAWVIISRY